MSHQPPLPEEAVSPYPLDEPPHESEAVTLVKEMAAAKKRWSPNARQIGLGAAVGIGSAAIVAGLLYWRGGWK
jgi:hypothetical protein